MFTLLCTAQSSAVDPALTPIHSDGGVTAKVTYLNPEGTEDTRFEISLDTHSVNLNNYDLKALRVCFAMMQEKCISRIGLRTKEADITGSLCWSSPRRLMEASVWSC